eukprot:gb/GEZN01018254.1/.p1 GENE.gb/GEZN01018254.1/~~gb/GEZN01018254.1/.p1  ORF type:complete len:202 (-),score=32.01 gb/GEZN01018254.1/:58-663(-)
MSNCTECTKEIESAKRCGRCKQTVYCSRECQTKHWKVHKKDCQEKEVKATFHTEDFVITAGFRGRPVDIFQAFTDPAMIKTYTQVPAKVDLKVGGSFTYFDGTITGKYVEISSPKDGDKKLGCKLVSKLRFKDWPDSYYSLLILEFTKVDETTTKLVLTHTGVPVEDKFSNRDVPKRTKKGWQDHFINRIQTILGYSKQDV